jgi:serine/threonine protein kinase/Tol biopolymer transport system component
LTHAGCPDSNTLSQLASGTLDDPRRAAILLHLDTCDACRRLAALAAGDALDEAVPFLRPGDTFGGYVIVELLGAGAMGMVYAARDEELQRKVALKLLRPSDRDGPEEASARERLMREAKAAAGLSHPNVVVVHEVGTSGGQVFIAMELVETGSLADWLAAGPRAPADIVAMFLKAGEGLAAAHEAGVVHRDFKPDNVLVGRDGRPRVADFGVARLSNEPPVSGQATSPDAPFAGTMSLTETGALIGTPAYMAPEQWRGEDADARSDQFAFAVALYRTLYGEPPFDPSKLARLSAGESLIPSPPAEAAVGATMRQVLLRALHTDPARRFPDMRSLLDALGDAHVERPPNRVGRYGAAAAAAFLLLATAITVAVVGEHAASSAPGPASSSSGPTASDAPPATPPLALQITGARRVTFGDGCDEYPSFMPGGTTVVYDSKAKGIAALYALDLTQESARALTPGPRDFAARVSPDGTRVTFVRFDGGIGSYVAPLEGATSARRLASGNARPSWSLDGKRVWVANGASLDAFDADTGAVAQSLKAVSGTPKALELPDGSLAVMYSQDSGSHVGGLAIHPLEGPVRWLLHADLEEAFAATPDGRHLLAIRTHGTGASEMLDVPVDGSPVTPLLGTGIVGGHGLALSSDGRRIAWSTCRPVLNYSAVDAAGNLSPVLSEAESDAPSAALVTGGTELAVVSMRSGSPRPWVLDLSGKAPARELPTIDKGDDATEIAVSADGKRYVVATSHGLAVGNLHGEAAVRAVTSNAEDAEPSFRVDGAHVVFTRHGPDGSVQVMSVPIEGGEPDVLLGPGTHDAAASPVDERIVYLARSEAGAVPMVWDGRTGERRRLSKELPAGPYASPRFAPDGRRVLLLRAGKAVLDVDVATGVVRRTIRTNDTETLDTPAYGASRVYVLRIQWRGNLWIADASY